MATNTKAGKPRLVCSWPGCNTKSFSRQCELKKHEDEHTKPHICWEPICNGRGFADKARLQRHKREKHQIAKFKCPVEACHRNSKPFARKHNLSLHIKNRHPERLNAQDTQSTTDGPNTGIDPSSSINDDGFDIESPQDEEKGNKYITLGIAALEMKLQEREAEKNELASVQAHVEKEIEALKMALDILNK